MSASETDPSMWQLFSLSCTAHCRYHTGFKSFVIDFETCHFVGVLRWGHVEQLWMQAPWGPSSVDFCLMHLVHNQDVEAVRETQIEDGCFAVRMVVADPTCPRSSTGSGARSKDRVLSPPTLQMCDS